MINKYISHYIISVVFGLISGLVGAAIICNYSAGINSKSSQIIASDLILVEQHGRKAAVLSANSGGAVLNLIDPVSQATLVTLGADSTGRYLRFFEKDGSLVMALNSLPPNGASTLYLGDAKVSGMVTLGADYSENDVGTGTDSWVLQLKNPQNTFQSLFQVHTNLHPDLNKPYAFMQLNQTRTLRLGELPLLEKGEK